MSPTAYENARNRVQFSPTLRQYEDIILYDWQEGDEHWHWVTTAPEDEIIDWAETVRAQSEEV